MILQKGVLKEIPQEIYQLIIVMCFLSTHIIGIQLLINVFHAKEKIHQLIIQQMEQQIRPMIQLQQMIKDSS